MIDKIIGYIVAGLGAVALILAIVIFATSGRTSSNNTGSPKGTDEIVSTDAPDSEVTEEPTAEPTVAPKGELAGLVICIDPGHQTKQMTDTEDLAPWDKTQKQKVSSGTAGKFTKNNEYEINLQVGLKVRDLLVNEGATVIMTRETNDVTLSNIDRAKIGNAANADIVLHIHCNGVDNETVSGIEMWVPGNGDNSAAYKELSAYDKQLASELLDALCAATGAKKRNVNTSDKYTGLNWSTVPSVIIELGFMSNETEDKNLGDDTYQTKIANAIKDWLISSTVLKRG